MDNKSKREKLLSQFNETDATLTAYTVQYAGSGPLARIKRLLRFPATSWKVIVYRLLRFIGIVDMTVETFWGRRFRAPLREVSSLYYFSTLDRSEQPSIHFLIKHLKPNDIFFDAGANYGFYSMVAVEIVVGGEVHAFEPSPRTFPYLTRAFTNSDTKNIFLNNVALGDRNGKISFYDGVAGQSSISTTLAVIAQLHFLKYDQVEADAITLDQYVQNHTSPTVIKLDIEGGEYNFIQGGRRFLQHNNPIILMEIWRGNSGEELSRKAVQSLYQLGYASYRITENGDLEHLENLNTIHDPQRLLGLFAFKKRSA